MSGQRNRQRQSRLRATVLPLLDGCFCGGADASGVDGPLVQHLCVRVRLPESTMAELDPVPEFRGLRCGCRAFPGNLSGCAGRGERGADWIVVGVTANSQFSRAMAAATSPPVKFDGTNLA